MNLLPQAFLPANATLETPQRDIPVPGRVTGSHAGTPAVVQRAGDGQSTGEAAGNTHTAITLSLLLRPSRGGGAAAQGGSDSLLGCELLRLREDTIVVKEGIQHANSRTGRQSPRPDLSGAEHFDTGPYQVVESSGHINIPLPRVTAGPANLPWLSSHRTTPSDRTHSSLTPPSTRASAPRARAADRGAADWRRPKDEREMSGSLPLRP
jgi:hypothetical protein